MDSINSLINDLNDTSEHNEIICEKHGPYKVFKFNFNGEKEFFMDKCPTCQEEIEFESNKRQELSNKKSDLISHKYNNPNLMLPELYFNSKMDNLEKNNENLSIIEYFNRYVKAYNERRSHSFLFYGKPGTGKTMLACSISNSVEDLYLTKAVYISLNNLFRSLKDTWKDKVKKESQVLDLYINVDILIIDELKPIMNDLENNMLFDILDKRYIKKMGTLFIGNLTQDEFINAISPRSFDRLRQHGFKGFCFDFKSMRTPLNISNL